MKLSNLDAQKKEKKGADAKGLKPIIHIPSCLISATRPRTINTKITTKPSTSEIQNLYSIELRRLTVLPDE